MNRGQRSYSIPNNVVGLANGGNAGGPVQEEQVLLHPHNNNVGGGDAGGEETEMPLLPNSKS